jgi:hypothetical protein
MMEIYIDLDVAASLSMPCGPWARQFGDEANIGYVALTRATRDLFLPPTLKGSFRGQESDYKPHSGLLFYDF